MNVSELNCDSVVSETTKRNKLPDDDATHEAKSMKYSPDRKTCMSKLIGCLSLLVQTSKPDFKHGAPGLFTHVCMKVSWIETLQFNKSIIYVGVHFKSHTLQLK